MGDLEKKAGRRRRLILWSACLLVLVPLAVLLVFQYRWLTRLERTSAVAREATLRNYADAIVQEVEYAYVRRAERALNLPSYLFDESCLLDVGEFFERKNVDGVRRFFIISQETAVPGALFFFDPQTGAMEPGGPPVETDTVLMATSAWQNPSGGALLSARGFFVGDLDPGHPVIFHPIKNAEGTLVGLAGMIVDRRHFEREILPAAIEKALPRLSGRDRLIAAVRDAQGRNVLPMERPDLGPSAVERRLTFAFSGWRLDLHGPYAAPDKWARANFVMNLSLSLLLAAVVLGGVFLVLKTAAREMKLSEMKNDFVSNVSHELKTPLASVRVFGELLRLGRIEDRARIREFGGHIENESRRLAQLVDNILDFSKIESGRRIYRFAPASLHDVVSEARKTCEVALKQRGGRLVLTLPPVPLPDFAMDADAMVLALSNLFDNAVKYSGDQAPLIHLRLAAKEGGVMLEVTDRGIGVAPDEQERIFERFHRVGTGLVHDVKGSGLGLAIVRHIARAHGGRVTVESEPGRGSTFALHLPVKTGAGRAVEDAPENGTSRESAAKNGAARRPATLVEGLETGTV